MVNRVKTLYELQLIDNHLDELEELRGDLPRAVNELKSLIDEKQDLINEKEKIKKDNLEKIKENEEESARLNTNLTKYKAQLFQVRNNKEYDALTKEIDHSEETILALQSQNKELEEGSQKILAEIDEITPEVDKLNEELQIKEEDLKTIVSANEREEVKLESRRESMAEKVRKPDLNTYMRIRKAKGGMAVSTINRGACSGCHSMVPPQRQLEIKQNKRIYSCEACGRMIISADVAEEVKSKFTI
ncbi:MAG: hypothetical protein JEY94_05155 [Melioribacteraceae bacterium]|nr:hypothetical protein [Melioribacteraceae bacterium]